MMEASTTTGGASPWDPAAGEALRQLLKKGKPPQAAAPAAAPRVEGQALHELAPGQVRGAGRSGAGPSRRGG